MLVGWTEGPRPGSVAAPPAADVPEQGEDEQDDEDDHDDRHAAKVPARPPRRNAYWVSVIV
jgi:hypothetical protein